MKKFMQKLWKEESGASHIVEIVLVIIIVIALAGVLFTKLSKSVGNAATELDEFIDKGPAISLIIPSIVQ